MLRGPGWHLSYHSFLLLKLWSSLLLRPAYFIFSCVATLPGDEYWCRTYVCALQCYRSDEARE